MRRRGDSLTAARHDAAFTEVVNTIKCGQPPDAAANKTPEPPRPDGRQAAGNPTANPPASARRLRHGPRAPITERGPARAAGRLDAVRHGHGRILRRDRRPYAARFTLDGSSGKKAVRENGDAAPGGGGSPVQGRRQRLLAGKS